MPPIRLSRVRNVRSKAVLKKMGSKKALWEDMRSLFRWFSLKSMEMLYLAMLRGVTKQVPIIGADTS